MHDLNLHEQLLTYLYFKVQEDSIFNKTMVPLLQFVMPLMVCHLFIDLKSMAQLKHLNTTPVCWQNL